MDKIVLFFTLFIFSLEDIRKQSISIVWFWGLLGIVLFFLWFPPSWTINHSSSRLPFFLRDILSNITGYVIIQEWIENMRRQYIAIYPFVDLLFHISWIQVFCISILRGGVGFLFMFLPYVFSKKQGIGEGDIIFFTMLSPLFPVASIWVSFCITFLAGSIFAIVVIFVQKVTFLNLPRIKKIPLIPFISLGFIVGMLV